MFLLCWYIILFILKLIDWVCRWLDLWEGLDYLSLCPPKLLTVTTWVEQSAIRYKGQARVLQFFVFFGSLVFLSVSDHFSKYYLLNSKKKSFCFFIFQANQAIVCFPIAWCLSRPFVPQCLHRAHTHTHTLLIWKHSHPWWYLVDTYILVEE